MPESKVLSGLRMAVLAAALALTGCATLDGLTVAQTERLDEGEFYADMGPGLQGPAEPVVVLPAVLDPELADSLSYGRRAGEFAPILAALNTALANDSCCRWLPAAAQVLDVGKSLDDRTLRAAVTTERRKDLPGEPMKWQAALDNLLWQLRGDRRPATVP